MINLMGRILTSKNYGEFEVLEQKSHKRVLVKFIKTGYTYSTEYTKVRQGKVRDPYAPNVCGVGIVGTKYPTTRNGVCGKEATKEYRTWHDMLVRCYNEKYQAKKPTYKGCTVSENFKHYEYFYEWCQKQKGFGTPGFVMDKDILLKGNKVYHEDLCVFVPAIINTAFTKNSVMRGNLPIGVSKRPNANTYHFEHGHGGLWVAKGKFKTPEEAFTAYKKSKEDYLKLIAEQFKPLISEKTYDALCNYQVEVTD